MTARIVPLGYPVLGPLCEQIREHFADVEPLAARRTREQQREDREALEQETATDAYNEIYDAIVGHVGDSSAMVSSYRYVGIACRETRIPVTEALSLVIEAAPVVEALRAMLANPTADTAHAFELAVATKYADDTYKGLAEARQPN